MRQNTNQKRPILIALTCVVALGFYAMDLRASDIVNDAEPAFFSVIQDVPVMPGLMEIESRSFSFDKPEGGIAQVSAHLGRVNTHQVIHFYDVTLPQLGWGKIETNRFYRQNEFLQLDFEQEAQGQIVKIMVKPTL